MMILKDTKRNIFLPFLLLFLPAFILAGPDKDRISELRAKIDSVVQTIDCDISVKVVSALKYDMLYEYKPERMMIPASITKLVTSAIALNYLGTGYEFRTIVYTDDNNVSDGIINGNLYIKGFGDPDFNSDNILTLVQKISSKNIKKITGNVVYDDSYFDDNYYALANYYQGDTRSQYWPYVNALSFNKNKGANNPAYDAADYLSYLLDSRDIAIEGIVVAGKTPSSANELARITHDIGTVLANMNKPSDNHSAITVFKAVGALFTSPPGTLEKGTQSVIELFSNIGIARNDYEILEGSGLTRFNYVNSNAMIQLLKYMYDREKVFDIFYRSLAIGGYDGTLRDRMLETEAEMNIHAKTGTLNGVSTLAGYAVSRDNELIIFYIAMNGFSGNAKPYRQKQDDICEILCMFSRK